MTNLWRLVMLIDTGTMLAIIIALAGSITVMCLFWKQNAELTKENYRLRNELRKSKVI
jgi:undecaprenyl pyrophosphate phosphatase UppP